jgi:hypothetical protein
VSAFAILTPVPPPKLRTQSRGTMPALTYAGPGENVLVFVPNLIGYARVVSAQLSGRSRPANVLRFPCAPVALRANRRALTCLTSFSSWRRATTC